MWTDTHCHLDEDRYRGEGAKDLGGTIGVLENARAAKVSRFITVGCDEDSSRAAIKCANQFDDVWASVGLHPHEAVHGVETILQLISSPRVVAIGEAGLDYYYEHSARDEQKIAFAAQIQLAHQYHLPLIIHTRDAWADTFDILHSRTNNLSLLYRRARRSAPMFRYRCFFEFLWDRHFQDRQRRRRSRHAVST